MKSFKEQADELIKGFSIYKKTPTRYLLSIQIETLIQAGEYFIEHMNLNHNCGICSLNSKIIVEVSDSIIKLKEAIK